MAKKTKSNGIKRKEIRPRTVKQIERKIAKLEEEIEEFRIYDLRNPDIQEKIKSRRNMIFGLLYAQGREKEYDFKKYFGSYF